MSGTVLSVGIRPALVLDALVSMYPDASAAPAILGFRGLRMYHMAYAATPDGRGLRCCL